MSTRIPDSDVVRMAVDLACRAPSVHNSQPWHWRYETGSLHLHGDSTRMLGSVDPSGRQLVLSCGAALHHLQVAFTALKWSTDVRHLPEGAHSDHLATVRFGHGARPASHDFDLVAAIRRRYSDRRPLGAPDNTTTLDVVASAGPGDASVTVLSPEARATLADATARSAALRRYDTSYQQELHWWAGHTTKALGIPPEALVTTEQHRRVDIGRSFPAGNRTSPADAAGQVDASTVLLVSTPTDERRAWLAAGRMLSALLLEATAHRLASCPLTHVTELPGSREIIAGLAPDGGCPQALIRIGTAVPEGRPAPTPRLPTEAVLSMAHGRR
ncbi:MULTISPECIES: Acg family FMN-binding oxidoreductase [unclassified Rhodococcus (in: high G+C Gram-positive bacteria)]|uniref:Acg family FMN-binding oxidoreductase n=1 Tax=Rhodococcus sp. SJ-3 TaxID=3454628 RepID=UPI003F7A2901